MQLDINLFAAFTAVVVGVVAYLSNPSRKINRLFVTISFHAALWLVARRMMFAQPEGLLWLRISTSIGAFFPLHFWIVKETVVNPTEKLGVRVSRGWLLLVITLVIGIIPFTAWFIPPESTADERKVGFGYHAYTGVLIVAYFALLKQTISQIRLQKGVSRLELQLLLLGGCGVAGGILLLMGLRTVLGDFWLIRINPQPVAILVFYTATVVTMTTYRIFDARQIALVGLQQIIRIVGVAGVAVVLFVIFSSHFPEWFSVLLTTAFALWIARRLSVGLDKLLRFYPEATGARQAAYTAAQQESRAERLEAAFQAVLRGWGQSERAIILSGANNVVAGSGIELSRDDAIIRGIRQLKWATPERLARERGSIDRDALARFLSENQLGVLVIAEGPSLTTLIGVGVGASRRPYTYPQVTQLMELASIMESALERAHFSAKVQHAEQLATVGLLGASLAHEIRNPLVSIKTFVQLLPTHYQDPQFREKFFRLIGSEVTRIDQLTEQLLDLASPRTYTATLVDLHTVLRSSLDLVAAKAADKSVEFLTDFRASPDAVYTDPAAAKQVMLNLCFNAIQAVEAHGDGPRWIKITTQNTAGGVEMAVSDNGPGIAPEIQQRLFQPFQTTKSTGFGLGLAICRDILANLGASISVDPPAPGQGATFRVVYPCQASSS